MSSSIASPVDAILLIEQGPATEEEIEQAYQLLIDTGVVWHLQGSHGRAAAALIESGRCLPRQLSPSAK